MLLQELRLKVLIPDDLSVPFEAIGVASGTYDPYRELKNYP